MITFTMAFKILLQISSTPVVLVLFIFIIILKNSFLSFGFIKNEFVVTWQIMFQQSTTRMAYFFTEKITAD